MNIFCPILIPDNLFEATLSLFLFDFLVYFATVISRPKYHLIDSPVRYQDDSFA